MAVTIHAEAACPDEHHLGATPLGLGTAVPKVQQCPVVACPLVPAPRATRAPRRTADPATVTLSLRLLVAPVSGRATR